jgi:hypothetical protein
MRSVGLASILILIGGRSVDSATAIRPHVCGRRVHRQHRSAVAERTRVAFLFDEGVPQSGPREQRVVRAENPLAGRRHERCSDHNLDRATDSIALLPAHAVHTLSVRQSSLDGAGVGAAGASPRPSGRKFRGCGHYRPKRVASRTSVHAAGATGGRQRRSPIGAAAYGTPLNVTMSVAAPRTGPDEVCTVVKSAAALLQIAHTAGIRHVKRAANCMESL